MVSLKDEVVLSAVAAGELVSIAAVLVESGGADALVCEFARLPASNRAAKAMADRKGVPARRREVIAKIKLMDFGTLPGWTAGSTAE